MYRHTKNYLFSLVLWLLHFYYNNKKNKYFLLHYRSFSLPLALFCSFWFLIAALSSCQQEDLLYSASDAQLELSADTITFDTVFTNIGSTINGFLLYNPYNRSLNISRIELSGGSQSNFRINVDGINAPLAENIQVLPGDSMYVFVEVTVDPNQEQLPFVIEDSILLTTNGNLQKVYLNAWGQNAHYLRADSVYFWEVCDEVFEDDLPYIVFGGLYVPPNCTLTLAQGVDLHIHPKTNNLATFSGIWVEGTLLIEGEKDSLVEIKGMRLEDYFDDKAAQWGAIHLLRGSSSSIRYASIKNNIWGITVGKTLDTTCTTIATTPKANLNIKNSTIYNNLEHGIEAILSNITAENCLIYNCGKNNVLLQYGGEYQFTNCTFVNYGGNLSHQNSPVAAALNFIVCTENGEQTAFAAPEITNILFKNCIIHGSREEEWVFNDQDVSQGAEINFEMSNCILRTKHNTDTLGYTNCIINPLAKDTMFVKRSEFDFHLHPQSPAIDKGNWNNPLTEDLDGNPRSNIPDIGCYEYQ